MSELLATAQVPPRSNSHCDRGSSKLLVEHKHAKDVKQTRLEAHKRHGSEIQIWMHTKDTLSVRRAQALNSRSKCCHDFQVGTGKEKEKVSAR